MHRNCHGHRRWRRRRRMEKACWPGVAALCIWILWWVGGAEGKRRELGGWDGIVITQSNYQGLQAFRHDIVDPSGVLRSWNGTGLEACSGRWAGIKCVRGQVIAIQLPWKGLGGRISEKIGQLTALRKISLHDNVIGGSIPATIGYLKNLRGVYLFNNRLSGSIPPEIGNSPLLQSVDFSGNSLVGGIPASVANSSRLYRVNLSYNNLSGSIPVSLSRSATLNFLSLNNNNLSGSIPDTWGGGEVELAAVPHQLLVLNLDNNSLSGSIPASLGGLRQLKVITAGNNQIHGSIPEELGNLANLQQLDLSGNAIAGGFPASICKLTSLMRLSLGNNRIGDGLPNTMDGMSNLSTLSLENNRFEGPIPASIGNISTLASLDLSRNNFTGEIPGSFEGLANLNAFNVSVNRLSGEVPLSLAEKFDPSAFRGNLQLCGYSAAVPCPSPPSISLPPSISPPQPKEGRGRRFSTKEIILIVAGCVLVALVLLCCILLFLLRNRSTPAKKEKTHTTAAGERDESSAAAGDTEVEKGSEAGGKLVHFDGPMVFTADDLLCATAEIMGKSTYGTVYKATLEDGSQVAVKRLREKIAKGQKEFEAEVNALGKIRHRNLISLRAYYLGPKGEKLLVFDYMPKGSLAAFLHARGPDTSIDWRTRMGIAMGTTRGLLHLHTAHNMIHGNMTSSNVLLDDDAAPKIADFGLSRLMTAAASANVIATAGALGYRAPELSKLKKANAKTDVYSLGVVILELLTGKSPGEAMNGADLPQWVASIVKEEWTNEVFDLELMRDVTVGDELLNTLKLALHCVDPSPTARPEVQQVLQQLEEIKPDLAAGCSGEATVAGEELPPAAAAAGQ